MTKSSKDLYLELIKERVKKGRVTKSHQMTGLALAEILEDEKHKSLYMKLAKEYDQSFLIGLARDVADRKNIKNKGAYFMRLLHNKIAESTPPAGGKTMKILTTDNKKEEKFLKTKTKEVDFKKEDKKELKELIKKMRATMKEADGVGLSANQVGVGKRIFVAQIPNDQGKIKFYAVINPKITKESKKKITLEEGCLSIPQTFGQVERAEKITLEGYTAFGKKQKIKAWGLLARVFQHEVDHLNGVLFTNKVKEIHRVTNDKITDSQ